MVLNPNLLPNISLQQSLIHIPMNDPSVSLPYTQANDSVIPNATLPSMQAIEQTIPVPQASQLIQLSCPGGGIFCANIGCIFKRGNCTQGHTECSDLLCKKCCHNATILAQQLWIDCAPCQERQHWLANAGGPVPNPPQDISAMHVAAGSALELPLVPAVGPQPNVAPSPATVESIPQPSTP